VQGALFPSSLPETVRKAGRKSAVLKKINQPPAAERVGSSRAVEARVRIDGDSAKLFHGHERVVAKRTTTPQEVLSILNLEKLAGTVSEYLVFFATASCADRSRVHPLDRPGVFNIYTYYRKAWPGFSYAKNATALASAKPYWRTRWA
jgi:hypothetical protein